MRINRKALGIGAALGLITAAASPMITKYISRMRTSPEGEGASEKGKGLGSRAMESMRSRADQVRTSFGRVTTEETPSRRGFIRGGLKRSEKKKGETKEEEYTVP